MNTVEAQLAAYRARKTKEKAPTVPILSNIISRKSTLKSDEVSKEKVNESQSSSSDPAHITQQTENDYNASERTPSGEHKAPRLVERILSHPRVHRFIGDNKLTFLLKLTLWCLLLGLFVELEFGSVFFVASLFYVIYANMRSGPSLDGAPSAYSVFNPNCERLEGTFTSEQFERELRYGAGSVGH